MKDIFISYRRENKEGQAYGTTIANLIYDKLNDAGYKGRVFLDHEGIINENFEERILKTIRQAKVFILLLTQDTLDRCQNVGDWVRREICVAKEANLEIIVINYNNEFKNDYPKDFPEELCWLKTHNRQIVRAAEFSDDMAKLINNIVSPAIKRKKFAEQEMQRYQRRQKIRGIIKSQGQKLKYAILGGLLVLFAYIGITQIVPAINEKQAEKKRLEQEEVARQARAAEEVRLAEEAEKVRQARAAEEARKAREADEARKAREAEEAAQLAKEQEEADRLAKEKKQYLNLKKEAELKKDEFYLSKDSETGKAAIELYRECLIKYGEHISQDEKKKIEKKIEIIEKYI